jgi:hypothetical protein
MVIEDQWKKYFNVSQNLTKENDSTSISLVLSSLIGNNLTDFWRYDGSLSIPPCTEGVIWTVFKQSILILNYDFEQFRDYLFFESYRGPQPLYERPVLRSFPGKIDSPIPEQRCCLNKEQQSGSSLMGTTSYFSIILFVIVLDLINI